MFNFFKKKKKMDEMIKKSVEAFKNRPVYLKLNKEIIDGTSDDFIEQLIFDNICQIVGAANKDEFEAVKDLTIGQRASYSVWCVEAEVNNGGFNQFYFNSSGQFAQLAVEGFRTFGANKFAALMEKANSIHSEIKDDLGKFNDGTVEGFSKSYENNALNDLDTQFFALYKEEEISKLRINYSRSHIQEFI